MKRTILILIILHVQILNSQNIRYSFSSSSKAYQKVDQKGNLLDYSLWKKTDVLVKIKDNECIVIESGKVNEFKIVSSELIKDKVSRVLIKAEKNKNIYELEIAFLGKEEFLFLIKSKNKIEVFKFNKLNKI